LEPLEDRALLAAVITVNSVLDSDARDAFLTLREAISVSNRTLAVGTLTAQEQAQVVGTPAANDTDTIGFNIPGTGVRTITLDANLPAITDAVVIDGYTQAGAKANTNAVNSGLGLNTVLTVEIDGAGRSFDGLRVEGTGTTIRGLVINDCHFGVTFVEVGNTLEGSFIGTNASGTAGVPSDYGVFATANTTIGGTTPAARNLISGNGADGIILINIDGGLIQGNLLGTDITGTAKVSNGVLSGGAGVHVNGTNVTIGGTAPGARNVISGNSFGVLLNGTISPSTNNIVQGNYIGTSVSGTADLGNDSFGVQIAGATNSTIGGTVAGAGNVIAFNATGVRVADDSATGNTILGNSIFKNVGLGIDLGFPGATPNDLTPTPDADSGPNRLQNFPQISSAVLNGSLLTIQFTVPTATANATYPIRVEFFKADADGQEGQIYLGSDSYFPNDVGLTRTRTFNPPVPFSGNDKIVATATDSALPTGNTSEFTPAIAVQAPAACSFVVTTTADSGIGSLRDALGCANITAGTDTISFNIPATDSRHIYYQNDNVAGQVSLTKIAATTAADDTTIADIDPDWAHSWFSIQPTGPWPAITAAGGSVIIDGYTQTGASANTLTDTSNAVLRIEIDGINPPHSTTGRIDIEAGGSTIRGLVLNRQPGGTTAIYLGSNGGNTIAGNFIGTDVSGTLNRANNQGIQVSSDGNTIGGVTPAARNVISNNVTGVEIDGNNNVVAGNLIGLDRRGLNNLQSFSSGVYVKTGTGNMIGGTAAAARNVIVARSYGIRIFSDSNFVQGNFIGTDVTGNAGLVVSAIAYGIIVEGANNRIGGTAAGARNVISGNDTGIRLSKALNSIVEGNYIGTNAAGTAAIGNKTVGIEIVNDSDGTVIGGTAIGAGNLISGNGVGVQVGVALNEFLSGIVASIQGNLIGTDVTGTLALGNLSDGIQVGKFAESITIGGSASAAGNIISGNQGNGIAITTSGHKILGNFIGTQIDGKSALGNGASGILIQASNTVIGGAGASERNTIAFNVLNGVAVSSAGAGNGNSILANFIYSNGAIGIDLADDGPTANDLVPTPDADDGANHLQNFPEMSSVLLVSGQTIAVSYAVPSLATNSTYPLRVEFFKADSRGDQGQTFLGFNTYRAADAGETKTAIFTAAATLLLGDKIVATATDAVGNTSEFSSNIEVRCYTIVTTTADSGFGSLRDAITCANRMTGPDTITFSIPGAGVQTISPTTNFPAITDAVIIDGYTQFGASPNTLQIGDNAKLMIELNGEKTHAGGALLEIAGNNSTLRGLVINRKAEGFGVVVNGLDNIIEGNFIGLNAAGTAAFTTPSVSEDIGLFLDGANNTTVGGTTPAARNLIAAAGESIGVLGNNNVVLGNYINVDASGSVPLYKDFQNVGVDVLASDNLVADNVISGHWIGILLTSSSNTVQGNLIGTDATGTMNLGNWGPGIRIQFHGSDNLIGGLIDGDGNTIAYNSSGIEIYSDGIQNSILRNVFRSNEDLAIDLGLDGATPNDLSPSADADTGPNNLQNFPEISYVTRNGGQLKLTYRVPSATENSKYPIRVELFRSEADGQGQVYLGFDTFTEADFLAGGKTTTLNVAAPAVGQKIVATATDSLATGEPANTSEFSPPSTVASPWKNPRRRWDVNDDTHVVAGDVIAVVNYINAKGSGPVPNDAANAKPFYDVNGDNNVAADDVLDVINYINAGLANEPEAEGEAGVSGSSLPAIDDVMALLAMEVGESATRKRR
jgi:parallel beta-helix repeat protein